MESAGTIKRRMGVLARAARGAAKMHRVDERCDHEARQREDGVFLGLVRALKVEAARLRALRGRP